MSPNNIGFKLLSRDELYAIHGATLKVLNSCGVKVLSALAQQVYEGKGCRVDRNTNIVQIPSHIVEDAIDTAPGSILLAGKEPEYDYLCGSGISFSNFGEGVEIIDLFTKERRETTKKDVGDVARMCDAMDQINIHVKAVGANDVPLEVRTLHMYEAVLTNTFKHCLIGGGDVYNIKKGMEMASACVGGFNKLIERPIYTASFCVNSPLTLNPDITDSIIELAESKIPVMINTMPMSGATSPITLAGSLVSLNAEVLSGIILTQLVQKGTPVIYGSTGTVMDLRYATAALGSPEAGLLAAAAAKMARYYNLPSFIVGGFVNSEFPDAQAAHEKTLTCILPSLAGADIIFGMGSLNAGMTFDYAQLVMDNEFVRMVKKVIGGIKVTDEKLAVEVIKQVGAAGEFISHGQTLQLFKTEMSQSKLINRASREDYLAGKGKDLTERAYEEAVSIYKAHKPDPLPDEILSEIRSIVDEAEDYFGLEGRRKNE